MQPLTPSQVAYAQRRLAEIRAAISARLSSVTAEMTRSSFDELVDKMALLQLNGEAREAAQSLGIDRALTPGDSRCIAPPDPRVAKKPAALGGDPHRKETPPQA